MDNFNKAVKISIIVGILLVSFSLVYYLVYFLPQKENLKLKLASQKAIRLNVCLGEAESYRNNALKLLTENKLGLTAPKALAFIDAINEDYEERCNKCLRMYK